jgi:hypothetical protein
VVGRDSAKERLNVAGGTEEEFLTVRRRRRARQ